MEFLRKYGVAATINIPLIIAGSNNQATQNNSPVDYTPVAGDVKISKDEGAAANITTLPTAVSMGNGAFWKISLSATEMQAARIVITISDSATKAIEDQQIDIATYGNASAEHAFDLDTASSAQTGDAYAIVNNGTYGNSALDTDLNTLLTRIVGTLAAGTHNAQSGDVFGALPTNFASMVISASGAVDSLIQGFLNSLITEATAGRIAANFDTLFENADAAATLTLDTIALASIVATAAELAKVPKSDGSVTWNATALAQIVNGILDEALTAGTHNVANSLARRIRAIQEYGGYEGGAVWIDTVNGTTGTTDYENGTVVFPCDTIANANTIAISIGLSNFIIIPGSSITFAASQISQVFNGTAWTLALGGQDISNTAIKGCQSVTGIATTPTGEAHFYDCEISTTTLGQVHLKQCGLNGTITLSAAAVYTITASYSQTNTAPIIDFGAAVGSSEVDFVGWNGDIELQNMGQLGTDLVRWHGTGEITINANCVGGTLHVYGSPEITDNSGGAVTISYDDDTTDIKAILVDTGTTIPSLIPTAAAVAAAVYAYNMGNGRTIGEALAFLRNKWEITGSPATLVVYDTDDTTALWSSVLVKTAGDPVSSSDPV